jgi:chemotaxis signal transduction protein/truncated hemoglobin YjbI
MNELAVVDGFDHSPVDTEKLVTFKIDNQSFGIPILQVQDIVEPRMITPVPLAPSAIAGVMNLRGRIVTVINLRRCLGLGDKPESERKMSITVEYKGDLYTLLVDEIGDVCDLSRRDFENPPTTLSDSLRQICTGIFRLNNDLLVVLDVNRVLDSEMLMKTPPVVLKQRFAQSDKTAEEPGAAAGNVVSLETGKNTLFERIGGDAAVEAAVDIFYAKLMADNSIKPFFEGVDMDKQTFMQRLFLTGAFGGPQAYTGRSLRAAHKNLVSQKGLDSAHFATVAGHLNATLMQLGVAPDLIQEVMTIVASTRDDVLNL